MHRIIVLDALRGMASLFILIYHYKHFLYYNNLPGEFAFDSIFGLIYNHGWLAVDFFFCLSGFIFATLYGDKVASAEIKTGTFWLNRFSRLYPLHLVTLLATAALLAVYTTQAHSYFMSQTSDTWKRFIAELFLVNQWHSGALVFNRSAWSISVELLMYILFFVACKTLYVRIGLISVSIAITALVFHDWLSLALTRGFIGFFGGVAAHRALEWLKSKKKGNIVLPVCAATLALSAALIYATTKWNIEAWHLRTVLSFDLGFMAIIVAASGVTIKQALVYSVFEKLGALSYPAYMIHFPLQIMIVTLSLYAGFALPVHHKLFFMFYIAIVVWLSLHIHKRFEVVARTWIKQKYLVIERALLPKVGAVEEF